MEYDYRITIFSLTIDYRKVFDSMQSKKHGHKQDNNGHLFSDLNVNCELYNEQTLKYNLSMMIFDVQKI